MTLPDPPASAARTAESAPRRRPGALLIARPGSDGFTWWAALILLATLCSAVRDIYTRVVPQRVPSLIITLATSVAVTLTGMALTGAAGWQPMSGRQWSLLFAASIS